MVSPALRRRVAARQDLLLTGAALVLALAAIPTFGRWHATSGWSLALTVAAWVPLLARTRWPLPVAALAACLDAVHIAVAAHAHPPGEVLPVATMLGLYTVATRLPAPVAWTAAAGAAAVQVAVAASTDSSVKSIALYANWALVATAVGRLLAERRERIAAAEARATAAEASKAAEARRQVSAERLRIAHELHDVLAHHIAVVNAQAGVAQYLLRSDPDTAEQALTGIVDNTRAALDDLRATLGVLRADGDATEAADGGEHLPLPGAAQLPALFARYADTGINQEVTVTGSPRPLSAAADLALYRITQEALTNASKHASGSSVRVELIWTDTAVTVTVTNSAPAARPSVPTPVARHGTGNGLLGMRERAAAAGGTLDAGPTASGGWCVRACLLAPNAARGSEQDRRR